jgi:hypothetical protein
LLKAATREGGEVDLIGRASTVTGILEDVVDHE